MWIENLHLKGNAEVTRGHPYLIQKQYVEELSHHFIPTRDESFENGERQQKKYHKLLIDDYNNKNERTKKAYEVMAERDLVRSRNLLDEVKTVLLRTKGKISFCQIADYLNNIVSINTIRQYLTNQPTFGTRKDRILPALDKQAMQRRFKWAQTYWLFWSLCKSIPSSKARLVLMHMDEKWFYACRTRTNCKVYTDIGLDANEYYAHHKSHIQKEMYIVCTAYVLNKDNDIRKGGTVIPVALVRVGHKTQAKKDSYKREYKNDGSYHYPKI